MLELLSRLGVGLSIARTSNKSDLGGLHYSSSGWEILLKRPHEFRKSAELSSRERFTVAHEVGHYLVEGRFGFRPRSKGEYWRLEEICNEFAGALLVPKSAVTEILRKDAVDASELLVELQNVVDRSSVSFEVASRRMISLISRPVMLAALKLEEYTDDSQKGLLSWVARGEEKKSSTRNKKISAEHPLACAFDAARGLKVGDVTALEYENATSACIHRRKTGDAYLAAVFT